MKVDYPDYMFAEEAGRYIAPDGRPIPPSTMQYWRHKDRGPPYFKVGKRVIYARADLDAYLASCRHMAAPAPAPTERHQEVLDKEAEKAKEAAARLKAEQEEAPAPARRKPTANAGGQHGQ